VLLALRSVNQRPAIGEQNMNIGTRVVVGADVLEALEVSDAPDLERTVPGARVEQRGVVHGGGDGEAGDAVGVLDPEATVAAPRHCLHIAGLAEHLAQVPTDWRRRWWRSLHHTESRTQEWGLGVQVWTVTWTPRAGG